MKSKKTADFGKTSKKKIILALCTIILALIIYSVVTLRIVSDKNPLFRQSYEQKDVLGAYDALFSKIPATANRPYIGLQNAPLTIMVIIDFKSDSARSFYAEKMPELKKAYVDTGQARLYHKYIITSDELNSRTGRFIYSIASRCYHEFDFNRTVDFNIALFKTDMASIDMNSEITLGVLADEFQITRESFLQCVKNSSFKELYQDALETEDFLLQSPSIQLGVNGQDNIVLYGNPSMELIQKRMRLQQIKVGI
jgi:protein-disulfide isomerase